MKAFINGISLIALTASALWATQLAEVKVVDKDYLMVHFLDGEVVHHDDGTGTGAFLCIYHANDDTVKSYTPVLDTVAAATLANWTLTSSEDADYSTGVHPTASYRKKKLNGHAEEAWNTSTSDFDYESTYAQWIYLKLPSSLEQGDSYTLTIADAVGSDQDTVSFTYDIFSSRSEAIHVNLVGYPSDAPIKAADLDLWMGDGGARDYSSFVGNTVYLYNVETGTSTEVGSVTHWSSAGTADAGGWDYEKSDVWNADFSSFTTKGTYRLAIEGVGASEDFKISDDIYFEPYQVSVQGFFYMRIGQETYPTGSPVPRRPLYIPGESPATTSVVITTVEPYSGSDWTAIGASGDPWDNTTAWSAYATERTNSNAKGGHSDAADWDRYLGHVSIIYDMLLPFVLSDGKISDDNLGIAESGNGIPDILDEARYEVDFWLNLRDGAGYSHGVNNPTTANKFYQAGTTTVAAWANAANAAMLGYCFQLAGLTDLAVEYRDSAVVAYNYASSQTDQQLDSIQDVGESKMKGRDFKMTAAAYLFDLTGESTYEDAVEEESVNATSSTAEIINTGSTAGNQIWAVAGYLKTQQTTTQTTLISNMKTALFAQAESHEVSYISTRPTRRAADGDDARFKTVQNVHRTIVAHAVTESSSDKELYLKAMLLEAGWGLGRNAANIIFMTTASTSLQDKRSIEGAYTSGHNDGIPGDHPGHTPYVNTQDWYSAMVMGSPTQLMSGDYPSDFETNWPMDESYHNTRYVYAANEFTPQQSMRGKMALYGYLYSLGETGTPSSIPTLGTRVSFANTDVYIAGSHFNVPMSSEGLFRVFDLNGKLQWQCRRKAGGTIYLDFRAAHSGAFILQMQSGGRVSSHTFHVR